MPRSIRPMLVLPLAAMMTLAACGRDGGRASDGAAGSANVASGASGAAGSAASGGQVALTEDDLDVYERGLRKEIELVKAAQERARTATTPQARGEAMQAQWKEQTMPAAAQAIGVAPERYGRVRETVHEVLQTLDFQGKIEGPMQMDTAHASPEMKARLARDPMADLPPASAAALRARLDRLAPLFAEYVTLTAVGG